MLNPSTEYYRRNKITQRITHKCPHCNYKTTNPKICLINHIYAKHTPEEKRPYQCYECTRGFAQKAHLDKHLEVCHNIKVEKKKVSSISYIIKISDKLPRSTKTRARRQYYKNHKVINTNDINNLKHEYLPEVFLKKHDIHYDMNKGFINVHKCSLYKCDKNCRMTKICLRCK